MLLRAKSPSEGGTKRLETLIELKLLKSSFSNSNFSIRAFRAYPLVEIRQTVPCRAVSQSAVPSPSLSNLFIITKIVIIAIILVIRLLLLIIIIVIVIIMIIVTIQMIMVIIAESPPGRTARRSRPQERAGGRCLPPSAPRGRRASDIGHRIGLGPHCSCPHRKRRKGPTWMTQVWCWSSTLALWKSPAGGTDSVRGRRAQCRELDDQPHSQLRHVSNKGVPSIVHRI